MVTKEAIDAALTTHVQWKKRLQEAISTDKSEFRPGIVKLDNACDFGKWLYGFSEEDRRSQDYIKVKELHANFHIIASEILQLALSGKKDEAQNMLAMGGNYGIATDKLVFALQTWKSKL